MYILELTLFKYVSVNCLIFSKDLNKKFDKN